MEKKSGPPTTPSSKDALLTSSPATFSSLFSTMNVRKAASLIGFVFLDAALIIALRFCTIYSPAEDPYISSSAVFFTECLKLMFSIGCVFIVDAKGSPAAMMELIFRGFVDENSAADMLKLCGPAVLYTIQNNLQYIIETAPLFQVLYQLKIVTTAIFCSLMLSRRILVREWLAIIALVIGVGMVQASQTDIHHDHARNLVGIIAVFSACLTSGLAGVLFEKILKSSQSSIWIINVQLSLVSVALSMITCMVRDVEVVARYGFTKGFNVYVVVVVCLQAAVGLSVALVVKYADNIYKGFAASASIVLACLLDVTIFGETIINEAFSVGSFLVIASSAVFGLISSRTHIGTQKASNPHDTFLAP